MFLLAIKTFKTDQSSTKLTKTMSNITNSWRTKTLIVLGLFASILAFSQSISVNTTNYKQTIDMCGGDMERSSINIQWSTNKNEMIDWGFKDIAFNYCRVQYDKNQEAVEGTKNWAFYDKQVLTMQRVKLANPNIKFFATMRTDYDGYGNDNNAPDWIVNYTTKAIEIDKYAIFLADYLEYMNNQGLPIHTISITKEWTSFVYASRATKIITKLRSECTARKIPQPLISDQGFWSISQGIKYIDDVAAQGTKDQFDSFCSHDYQNEGDTKWTTIISKAAALGKKVYDDETSTGGGGPSSGVEPGISKPIGTYIEKCIAYEAGLSGEIFFEIWSRGIDKETRSIYCPWKGTGTRLRGYYIMKQFANNVLDSKYITASASSMSNVYTMTFRKGNQVMLWVINKGTTDYTAPITLDSSKYSGSITNYYWTDATTAEGASTNYTSTSATFSPLIKGGSMNCFIFNVTDNSSACVQTSFPKVEAECFTTMAGIQTEACTEGGLNVGYINDGDWAKYSGLNLSTMKSITARVASKSSGTIEVRLGSISGTLIGTIPVSSTGGNQNWVSNAANITTTTGIQDVYLVFKGGTGYLFNINWFEFSKDAVIITDIENQTTNFTTSIYPNPTLGIVTFSEQNKFTVSNSLGEYLLKGDGIEVDLSLYPAGIYILRVGETTQKIIKY